MASHVADFEAVTVAQQQPAPQRSYPVAQQMVPHHYQHPYPALPGPGQATVKVEPMDSRYLLNPPQGMAYTIPQLPGPQIPGRPPTTQPPVLTYPPQPPQVRLLFLRGGDVAELTLVPEYNPQNTPG